MGLIPPAKREQRTRTTSPVNHICGCVISNKFTAASSTQCRIIGIKDESSMTSHSSVDIVSIEMLPETRIWQLVSALPIGVLRITSQLTLGQCTQELFRNNFMSPSPSVSVITVALMCSASHQWLPDKKSFLKDSHPKLEPQAWKHYSMSNAFTMSTLCQCGRDSKHCGSPKSIS